MTITLTKRQLLALCFHVQPRQLTSLEQLRARRATWKAFGVEDLAEDISVLARVERVSMGLDWMDRKTEITGELSDETAKWLEDITLPPYNGIDGDHVYAVHEKLKAAKESEAK